MQPPKSPKIAVIDNLQCGLTPPPKGTPANIRMNLESLAYIFVAASMGLSSIKFVQ